MVSYSVATTGPTGPTGPQGLVPVADFRPVARDTTRAALGTAFQATQEFTPVTTTTDAPPQPVSSRPAVPPSPARGGTFNAFMLHALNNLMFGAQPKATGVVQGIGTLVTGQGFREGFLRGQERVLQELQQTKEAHSRAAKAGAIVGTFAPIGLAAGLGRTAIGKIVEPLTRSQMRVQAMKAGALAGGGTGALAGLGHADPEAGLGKHTVSTGVGALLGAGGGALTSRVAEGVAHQLALRRQATAVGGGVRPLSPSRRATTDMIRDAIKSGDDLQAAAQKHAALSPELQQITPVIAVVEPRFASRFAEAARNNPKFAHELERVGKQIREYANQVGAEFDALIFKRVDGKYISPVINNQKIIDFVVTESKRRPIFGRMVTEAKQLSKAAGFPVEKLEKANLFFLHSLYRLARARAAEFMKTSPLVGARLRESVDDLIRLVDADPVIGPAYTQARARYTEAMQVLEQLRINTGLTRITRGLYRDTERYMRAALQRPGRPETPFARGVVGVLDPFDPGGAPMHAGLVGFGISAVKRVGETARVNTTNEIAKRFLLRGPEATRFLSSLATAADAVKTGPSVAARSQAAGLVVPTFLLKNTNTP